MTAFVNLHAKPAAVHTEAQRLAVVLTRVFNRTFLLKNICRRHSQAMSRLKLRTEPFGSGSDENLLQYLFLL